MLFNFTGGSDGSVPQSNLTPDTKGNFYGTTTLGGQGYGTVFELSPDGSNWNETTLYSFTGGADGANPGFSYLIFDGAGNLYGTTFSGGANGDGVVFELSPAVGAWKETVLYNFVGGSTGANPNSGLIMDKAGNFYGATAEGGAGNVGTIFELSPSDGSWSQQVIYNDNIHGVGNDGAGLIMDANGNIISASTSQVFKLSPNGKGGWTPTILHTFSGFKAGDFSYPGIPVLDSDGNLYGPAVPYSKNGSNTGIVYKISSENAPYKNLINFNSKEG